MNKSTIITASLVIVILLSIVLFSGDNKEEIIMNDDTTNNSEEQVVDVAKDTQDDALDKIKEQEANRTTALKIEVVQEGGGDEITNGSIASVHYTGKLTDGTVFDSSVERGTPFEFTLGAGQVIKGWDQGVLGMKVGEKRTLTIPAHLAYGASGVPGTIPANAVLVFDVELMEIK